MKKRGSIFKKITAYTCLGLSLVISSSSIASASKPYVTNPTVGKKVANDSITADGANNGEWTDEMIIAVDMANDDPRTLGENWTLHETPVDYSHLWAAWDDTNLYIAWQVVDVTDVVDPANAGSGDVLSSNDGILQWIAIDTKSGEGSSLDMWAKNGGKPYWTGNTLPDYQLYIASSLWQGFISKSVSGKFAVDDGGVNYKKFSAANIKAAVKNNLVPKQLWGVMDADDRNDASKVVDLLTKGHAQTKRDSFYELKIPLSELGIDSAYIESNGIGIMVGSALDVIPHDESTLDLPGVETWNSALEWGDAESLISPFARVGKSNGGVVPPPPPIDTEKPSTPGTLKTTVLEATNVTLGWTASTDNVGVEGYNVYRTAPGGTETKIGTVTTTSYVDSTVTKNTAYSYSVAAVDKAGNESTKATLSVTTPDEGVVVKKGDINLDGAVNATDALFAIKIGQGTVAATAEQRKAGDVNNDGKVNVLDALRVLRAALGKTQL